MEIIVVDNHPKKSAEHIVSKFPSSMCIKLLYLGQPIKNISLTRNLAVENASGQYILFIDDDEVASPDWVSNLLIILKKFNADGVFGYVEPEFHRDAAQWIKQRDFFFSPMTPTGTEAKFTFTTNCLLKSSLLKGINGPFDVRYGISGGGDPYLFETLKKQGAKFVNCREAVTMEYLPLERSNLTYILKRALKGGNTGALRIIDNTTDKKIFQKIIILSKAFANLLISSFLLFLFYPKITRRTKNLMKIASNVGRVLSVFGWRYMCYR